MKRISSLTVAAALLAGAGAAQAEAQAAPQAKPALTGEQRLLAQQKQVAQATVTLPNKSCAGAVARDQLSVVTAAHCIPRGTTRMVVTLSDGAAIGALVETLDRDADLAMLRLDVPAHVQPLALSNQVPNAGDQLLFVGRIDRRSKTQIATVKKLGHCPSLPKVPNAVFTSVQAKPGDSGSPLVNEQLEVVGVIHGGSHCHIAAPTRALAGTPDADSAPGDVPISPADPDDDAAQPQPPADAPSSGTAAERRRVGPFVVESTPNGYRLHWSFSFSFGL